MAGRLTHEDQVGPRVADAEDDVLPAAVELAAPTVSQLGADVVEEDVEPWRGLGRGGRRLHQLRSLLDVPPERGGQANQLVGLVHGLLCS